MIATLALSVLFDHYEIHVPKRPTVFAIAVISCGVALRWRLRRHLWFWLVVGAMAVLHASIIYLSERSSNWVPAATLTVVGMLDLYVMLVVIAAIERSRPETRSDII